MVTSADSTHRVRRIAWLLGFVAGFAALVIALIRYATQGELRLDLVAAGFTIIVLGLLMKPSRLR